MPPFTFNPCQNGNFFGSFHFGDSSCRHFVDSLKNCGVPFAEGSKECILCAIPGFLRRGAPLHVIARRRSRRGNPSLSRAASALDQRRYSLASGPTPASPFPSPIFLRPVFCNSELRIPNSELSSASASRRSSPPRPSDSVPPAPGSRPAGNAAAPAAAPAPGNLPSVSLLFLRSSLCPHLQSGENCAIMSMNH